MPLKKIQANHLLDDLERYIKEVKESLIRSERERTLDQENQKWRLLSDLTHLKLSRRDWIWLQGMLNKGDENMWRHHLAFYRNAEKRDDAFYRNIMSRVEANRLNAAVMVAGGFHLQGMLRRLSDHNVGYVLISPHMDAVPGDTLYRAQMHGEVSWRPYLKLKENRIYLYRAFMRGVRDRLLTGREDLAKPWRDQIIRDLAVTGSLKDANEYTIFLDELNVLGRQRNQALERAERFTEGLKLLHDDGQLTIEKISRLLASSTITARFVNPANLVPGSYVTAYADKRNFAKSGRSEMRSDGHDRIVDEWERQIRSNLYKPDEIAFGLIDAAERDTEQGLSLLEVLESVYFRAYDRDDDELLNALRSIILMTYEFFNYQLGQGKWDGSKRKTMENLAGKTLVMIGRFQIADELDKQAQADGVPDDYLDKLMTDLDINPEDPEDDPAARSEVRGSEEGGGDSRTDDMMEKLMRSYLKNGNSYKAVQIALKLFQFRSKRDPVLAAYKLGNVYEELGEFNEAEKYYRRTVESGGFIYDVLKRYLWVKDKRYDRKDLLVWQQTVDELKRIVQYGSKAVTEEPFNSILVSTASGFITKAIATAESDVSDARESLDQLLVGDDFKHEMIELVQTLDKEGVNWQTKRLIERLAGRRVLEQAAEDMRRSKPAENTEAYKAIIQGLETEIRRIVRRVLNSLNDVYYSKALAQLDPKKREVILEAVVAQKMGQPSLHFRPEDQIRIFQTMIAFFEGRPDYADQIKSLKAAGVSPESKELYQFLKSLDHKEHRSEIRASMKDPDGIRGTIDENFHEILNNLRAYKDIDPSVIERAKKDMEIRKNVIALLDQFIKIVNSLRWFQAVQDHNSEETFTAYDPESLDKIRYQVTEVISQNIKAQANQALDRRARHLLTKRADLYADYINKAFRSGESEIIQALASRLSLSLENERKEALNLRASVDKIQPDAFSAPQEQRNTQPGFAAIVHVIERWLEATATPVGKVPAYLDYVGALDGVHSAQAVSILISLKGDPHARAFANTLHENSIRINNPDLLSKLKGRFSSRSELRDRSPEQDRQLSQLVQWIAFPETFAPDADLAVAEYIQSEISLVGLDVFAKLIKDTALRLASQKAELYVNYELVEEQIEKWTHLIMEQGIDESNLTLALELLPEDRRRALESYVSALLNSNVKGVLNTVIVSGQSAMINSLRQKIVDGGMHFTTFRNLNRFSGHALTSQKILPVIRTSGAAELYNEILIQIAVNEQNVHDPILEIAEAALQVVTAILLAQKLENTAQLDHPEMRAELLKDLFMSYEEQQDVLKFNARGTVSIQRAALKLYFEYLARSEVRTAA